MAGIDIYLLSLLINGILKLMLAHAFASFDMI